jgi:hypothetical protein
MASPDPVEVVRTFSRFHTRLVGALGEHLLAPDHSLQQLRVLYGTAQAPPGAAASVRCSAPAACSATRLPSPPSRCATRCLESWLERAPPGPAVRRRARPGLDLRGAARSDRQPRHSALPARARTLPGRQGRRRRHRQCRLRRAAGRRHRQAAHAVRRACRAGPRPGQAAGGRAPALGPGSGLPAHGAAGRRGARRGTPHPRDGWFPAGRAHRAPHFGKNPIGAVWQRDLRP